MVGVLKVTDKKYRINKSFIRYSTDAHPEHQLPTINEIRFVPTIEYGYPKRTSLHRIPIKPEVAIPSTNDH